MVTTSAETRKFRMRTTCPTFPTGILDGEFDGVELHCDTYLRQQSPATELVKVGMMVAVV